MNNTLTTRPRLAFYGDDFDVSIDALDTLHRANIKSVLFLSPPNPDQQAQFSGFSAFGVAGQSRSMTPAEMEQYLPPVFQLLKNPGAPIVHYVTSPSFESAPHVGSIAKVLEIARSQSRCPTIPILAGTPAHGTYCAFGNLFAVEPMSRNPVRIDHHPSLSSHPVTPMTEADLKIHLSQQSPHRIELFDLLALDSEDPDNQLRSLLAHSPDGILFDILGPRHLPILGSLIEEMVERGWPLFAIGSTSIEAALTSAWGCSAAPAATSPLTGAEQILVIHDGRSKQAQRQHYAAVRAGFLDIPVETDQLARSETPESALNQAVESAIQALDEGKSAILRTVDSNDSQQHSDDTTFRTLGFSTLNIQLKRHRTIGPKLGGIVNRILQAHPLKRIVVAGSEASADVCRALQTSAIEIKSTSPFTPPICVLHTPSSTDQMEVCFDFEESKSPDLWRVLRDGRSS